jgi:hypothetical protein
MSRPPERRTGLAPRNSARQFSNCEMVCIYLARFGKTLPSFLNLIH